MCRTGKKKEEKGLREWKFSHKQIFLKRREKQQNRACRGSVVRREISPGLLAYIKIYQMRQSPIPFSFIPLFRPLLASPLLALFTLLFFYSVSAYKSDIAHRSTSVEVALACNRRLPSSSRHIWPSHNWTGKAATRQTSKKLDNILDHHSKQSTGNPLFSLLSQ